jgi:PKD repeat protein
VTGGLSAEFVVEDSNPVAGETVTLRNESIAPGTTLSTIEWTVSRPDDDTETATGETYALDASVPGDYEVELRIETRNGNTDTRSRTVSVAEGSGTLDAGFEIDGRTPIEVGQEITLRSTSEGPIQDTEWELSPPTGRTEEYTGSTVSLTLGGDDADPGEYKIRLTIRASDGREDYWLTYVDVVEQRLSDATDPDDDGDFEDVNGNGVYDYDDVVEFEKALENDNPELDVEQFDFQNSESLDEADLEALYREIRKKSFTDGGS